MSSLSFAFDKRKAQELIARLDVLRRAYPDAAAAACFAIASDIVTRTLPRVPVRTGALRASRFVTRRHPVKFGFGAYYAAIVDAIDKRSRRFFSGTLNDAAGSMLSEMAERTERYAVNGTTIANITGVHPEAPIRAMRRPKKGTRTRATRLRLRPKGRDAFRSSEGRSRPKGRGR